jgi:hypothetical protein
LYSITTLKEVILRKLKETREGLFYLGLEHLGKNPDAAGQGEQEDAQSYWRTPAEP